MSWLYTNLSIILIILAVMKQVYSFQAQCFYLFLSRGFTLAVLHIRGHLELKKRLIISHNCSVSNSTPSFKNLPGIPSIPYALLRSISISILQILINRLELLILKELEGIFRTEQCFFTEFSLKIFLTVGSFLTKSSK